MIIMGFLLLSLMGLTLGLVGAGGSILTLPILVYAFKLPVLLATTYSLLIVGLSAFLGMIRYSHNIEYKRALLFAIPTACGVLITRFWGISHLPKTIMHISIDQCLLYLLAIIMFFASYFMLKPIKVKPSNAQLSALKRLQLVLLGVLLGVLMGLVGAGGGFLIIPTLVIFLNLEMKEAVATSLCIITINSLLGFIVDPQILLKSDYMALGTYVTVSLVGMTVGTVMNKYVSGIALKRGFGWLVLALSISIVIKETFS